MIQLERLTRCGCLGRRASFKINLYKLKEFATFLLMTTIFNDRVGSKQIQIELSPKGGLFLSIDGKRQSQAHRELYMVDKDIWSFCNAEIPLATRREMTAKVAELNTPTPPLIDLAAEALASGDINKFENA